MIIFSPDQRININGKINDNNKEKHQYKLIKILSTRHYLTKLLSKTKMKYKKINGYLEKLNLKKIYQHKTEETKKINKIIDIGWTIWIIVASISLVRLFIF